MDKRLELRLFIVHPDQSEFYTTPGFLLVVLWDGLRSDETPAPFGLSADDIGDEGKVYEAAGKVIRTAGFVETRNHPRAVDLESLDDDAWDAYWADEDGLPQAVMWLELKSADEVGSLQVGRSWETSAYNI